MEKRLETTLAVLEETLERSEAGRIGELEKTVGELQKRIEEMKNHMESVNILDRLRVQMPRFEGPNPEEWIFRAENFFSLANFSEKQKLDASAVSLDGEALTWFRFSERFDPFKSWEDLKEGMLDRFSLCQRQLYGEFLNLRQEGTVEEYLREFERLGSKLKNFSFQILEGCFLHGLKPEIKYEVEINTTEPGLYNYIDCALRVEKRNLASAEMQEDEEE